MQKIIIAEEGIGGKVIGIEMQDVPKTFVFLISQKYAKATCIARPYLQDPVGNKAPVKEARAFLASKKNAKSNFFWHNALSILKYIEMICFLTSPEEQFLPLPCLLHTSDQSPWANWYNIMKEEKSIVEKQQKQKINNQQLNESHCLKNIIFLSPWSQLRVSNYSERWLVS